VCVCVVCTTHNTTDVREPFWVQIYERIDNIKTDLQGTGRNVVDCV